jgi:hypothetical protein
MNTPILVSPGELGFSLLFPSFACAVKMSNRVEREEAEREAARDEPGHTTPPVALPNGFMVDWNATYSDVALSPSLLAGFGVLGGTSQVLSGSSQGAP